MLSLYVVTPDDDGRNELAHFSDLTVDEIQQAMELVKTYGFYRHDKVYTEIMDSGLTVRTEEDGDQEIVFFIHVTEKGDNNG